MSAEDLTPENLQNPAIEQTDRSQFINRTYGHLLAAIFMFAGIEFWVFQTPYAEQLAVFMLQKSWLAVLGAFIVVSWIATHVAHNVKSKGAQYAALFGFVIAEAIIFIPMFFIALAFDPAIIQNAVMVTLGAFVVLSAVAMFSGRDFSFLRSFLMWGAVIALGTIAMGVLIGFHLGTYFSMAMIGFAGASILYDTQQILKSYPEDRYIAASLQLFASIALMLWYVLRFFLSRE